MDPRTDLARAALLPEMEAKLLEATLRERLFKQPSEAVQLGRYRLLARLGQGGMGVVYSAYDDQLDRRLALKLLHPGPAATSQARLRREAQALAQLSHPNVVQVFDIGEVDGRAYIAMEFVRGETLREWLSSKTRELKDILAVFVQAGRGLAAAHAAGLIHRDFKPENVLVGSDGRVRVVDFGLVRGDERPTGPASGGDVELAVTQTGAVLGTPAYMAPEQASGAGPVDARGDQFGFCVALHEALYGVRPFAGATMMAYLAAIARGEVRPPPPRSRVPARVRRAVLRGLAADPEARWAGMEELLAAIDPRPRRIVVISTLIAVALVTLVGGVFVGWQAWTARAQQAAAEGRFAVVEGRLAGLLAADQRAAGERLIGDFLAAAENRDAELGAHAWTTWAGLLESHGVGAQEAWANAYTLAREPGPRHEALRGLARAFGDLRRWYGAASALKLLASDAPALFAAEELLALRFEVATALRDLPAALALSRDPRAGPGQAALAPILTQLAGMTKSQYSDVRWIRSVDPNNLLFEVRPPGQPGHMVRVAAEPGLRSQELSPIQRRFAAGDSWFVEDHGESLALVRMGHDDPRPVHRWAKEGGLLMAAARVDLDGDGHHEIYTAQMRQLRALVVDGETWRSTIPHPATEAANSDIDELITGDLDGDGRPELIAALGPWSAYDLRVFRAEKIGALTLVARRKFSHISGLGLLRTPRGPRLVAMATQHYPNWTVFPVAQGGGATRGIHILRLEGDALVVEHTLPIDDASEESRVPRALAIGDLDGDGLDDLVVRVEVPPTPLLPARWAALIVRQLADGGFATMTLGGVRPLWLAQLDEDPADELLFAIDDDPTMWVAGVGAAMIAPASLPGLTFAEAHVQQLEAADAPAEVVALARVGAPELALATVTQAAALADDPRRRRLHRAAAAIAEDLQQHARAIALLNDVAEDEALRAGALERQVVNFLALGRLEAAAAASEQWMAMPGLAAAEQVRAAAVHRPLAGLMASRAAVPLRLADAPAGLTDPAALRRDPMQGSLLVDGVAGEGPALAWPVTWLGGQVMIEAALDPRELQWSSSLELRLVTADAIVARATVRVVGGDHTNELVLICGGEEVRVNLPVGAESTTEPFRLRLLVDPAIAAVECRIFDEDGIARPRASGVLLGSLAAAGLRLEIGAEPDFGSATARARFALSQLDLAGLALADPGPRDRHARAAALLADGDFDAALAVLAGLGDVRAQLWRAIGLAELGRWQDAATELAVAVTADATIEAELRRFLRGRPETLGPVMRAALGERRFLELFAVTWEFALSLPRWTPALQRALLFDLGGLDGVCAATSAPAETCRSLLRARGRAHVQRGDRGRGRRDLEAALRGFVTDPATAREASALHVDLAALLAGEGDSAAALGHARASLALHPAPEIGRDILRARAELDGVRASPAWQAMLGPDDRILE